MRFVVDALLVGAAEVNLVAPESKTRSIRFAVKEVEMVQANEEPGCVYRVGADAGVIIRDVYSCGRLGTKIGTRRITQTGGKAFRAFEVRAVDNETEIVLEVSPAANRMVLILIS